MFLVLFREFFTTKIIFTKKNWSWKNYFNQYFALQKKPEFLIHHKANLCPLSNHLAYTKSQKNNFDHKILVAKKLFSPFFLVVKKIFSIKNSHLSVIQSFDFIVSKTMTRIQIKLSQNPETLINIYNAKIHVPQPV